jgi:hypothetical protein
MSREIDHVDPVGNGVQGDSCLGDLLLNQGYRLAGELAQQVIANQSAVNPSKRLASRAV